MGECNGSECEEALRELEAFLDRELSPELMVAVSAHLDGCADCHGAYDFHAELKTVIARACGSDELPPGLLERIQRCFGPDTGGPAPATDPTRGPSGADW